MSTALLRRRAVVAAKAEAAEGTAETLTVAEAGVLVYAPKFDVDFDKFDRDPARNTLSHLAHLVGKQAAKLGFRTELKGSGTVATAPAWGPHLLGCGFQESRVSSVAIGAVTSGPFLPGETITQTTSGATGRVVGECATGASVILFVPISGEMKSGLLITGGTSGATATTGATGANYRIGIGAVAGGPFTNGETITGGTSGATGKVVGATANGATFIAYTTINGLAFTSGEVITGGTSAATATTNTAQQANQGFEYRPTSSPVSLTIARYMDGIKQLMFGARGNLKLSAQVGEPVFLEMDYMGVYDATTDTAILAPTYETTIPPQFMNVGFSMQGLSAVFSKFDVDMKNILTPRESANAVKGQLSVFIGGRNPSGPIDPEQTLVADHDFFGKLASGATGRTAFKIGSTQGNTVWVAGPLIQYDSIGDADRGGIAIAGAQLAYKSASVNTGDDELIIAVV